LRVSHLQIELVLRKRVREHRARGESVAHKTTGETTIETNISNLDSLCGERRAASGADEVVGMKCATLILHALVCV
jgi:hypothetical protein